jgi:hypothetical protein
MQPRLQSANCVEDAQTMAPSAVPAGQGRRLAGQELALSDAGPVGGKTAEAAVVGGAEADNIVDRVANTVRYDVPVGDSPPANAAAAAGAGTMSGVVGIIAGALLYPVGFLAFASAKVALGSFLKS